MKQFIIKDVLVETNVEDIELEEAMQYVDIVEKHNGGTLRDIKQISLTQTDEDGKIDISYDRVSSVKFERIARVTGYLSEVSNWNDGSTTCMAA